MTVFGEAVNQTHCLLNAGPEPLLVFRQTGSTRTIFDQPSFDHLQHEANL